MDQYTRLASKNVPKTQAATTICDLPKSGKNRVLAEMTSKQKSVVVVAILSLVFPGGLLVMRTLAEHGPDQEALKIIAVASFFLIWVIGGFVICKTHQLLRVTAMRCWNFTLDRLAEVSRELRGDRKSKPRQNDSEKL